MKSRHSRPAATSQIYDILGRFVPAIEGERRLWPGIWVISDQASVCLQVEVHAVGLSFISKRFPMNSSTERLIWYLENQAENGYCPRPRPAL
jgi:hypothetical protein